MLGERAILKEKTKFKERAKGLEKTRNVERLTRPNHTTRRPPDCPGLTLRASVVPGGMIYHQQYDARLAIINRENISWDIKKILTIAIVYVYIRKY